MKERNKNITEVAEYAQGIQFFHLVVKKIALRGSVIYRYKDNENY